MSFPWQTRQLAQRWKWCRPIDPLPEDAEEGDKWGNMEFWVKWKRWSYRHCSWDTLSTLSQLGGYKRVLNYCKRQDELEVGTHLWAGTTNTS